MRSNVVRTSNILLTACTLLIAGCGDEEGNDGPQTLARFGTYNVGLADGLVPLARERQSAVVDLIDATDFDVLCVQEVWLLEDVAAITESPDNPYASKFWLDTTQAPQAPACTEDGVSPLLDCVDEHDCENDEEAGLLACAVSSCSAEVEQLTSDDPDCIECLASALSTGSVDEMFQICVVEGGGTMFEDGRNGVILLSDVVPTETHSLVLSSFLIQRVALHVLIDLPDLGPTDVFCTHLATETSGIEYRGEYESYDDEQKQQLLTILGWIEQEATTGQVVLLGDFNNGPAVGEYDGELEEHYQLVIDDGFSSPYIESENPSCTYCEENTLVSDSVSKIIDHIFFRGLPDGVTFAVQLFGDEPVAIDGDQMSHTSDHFGLSVDVLR